MGGLLSIVSSCPGRFRSRGLYRRATHRLSSNRRCRPARCPSCCSLALAEASRRARERRRDRFRHRRRLLGHLLCWRRRGYRDNALESCSLEGWLTCLSMVSSLQLSHQEYRRLSVGQRCGMHTVAGPYIEVPSDVAGSWIGVSTKPKSLQRSITFASPVWHPAAVASVSLFSVPSTHQRNHFWLGLRRDRRRRSMDSGHSEAPVPGWRLLPSPPCSKRISTCFTFVWKRRLVPAGGHQSDGTTHPRRISPAAWVAHSHQCLSRHCLPLHQ